MDDTTLTFVEPSEAFERAIALGALSEDESAYNFVAAYMYMGTSERGHGFKRRDTREYTWVSTGVPALRHPPTRRLPAFRSRGVHRG